MSVSSWADSFPIINSARKTLFKSKLIGAVTAGVVGYAIYRGIKYALQKRKVAAKTLIAGGCLVLGHSKTGIVLPSVSKFYEIDLTGPQKVENVEAFPSAEQIEAAKQRSCLLILVKTPDFHSQTLYSYNDQSGQLVQLVCTPLASNASPTCNVDGEEMKKNEFVELCLSLIFIFLRARLTTFTHRLEKMCAEGNFLIIKLKANNDLYGEIKDTIRGSDKDIIHRRKSPSGSNSNQRASVLPDDASSAPPKTVDELTDGTQLVLYYIKFRNPSS
jgi:hypothetical protein